MRKKASLLLAASTLLALSTAVTGYNGSGGNMNIMKSSTGSSTAAGLKKADYRVLISEVAPENVNQTKIEEDSVELVEKTSKFVNFTGKIRAPTPCHKVTHDTQMKNGSLKIKISLEASRGFCTQVLVMKHYRGYVEAKGLEKVVITHSGEQMAVFEFEENQDLDVERPMNRETSILKRVMNWFEGLLKGERHRTSAEADT